MENSEQKQSRMALELQLVKDLEVMRDELMSLSLVLHDMKFLVDDAQRKAAQELAADCIVRSQSRQH